MKKIVGLFLVIASVFLLSGCVKNNNTMTINKDKSMDLEVELLVSTLLSDELSSKIDLSKYEVNGYKVTSVNYSDNGNTPNYSGVKLKKSFKNIDDYSYKNLDRVDLKSMIMDEDVSKLFVRKKCFLKDTYTAKFEIKIDETDNILNNTEITVETETTKTETTNDETTQVTETKTTEIDAGELTNKIANLSGEMDMNFIVNLPFSSNSSNADEKSDSDRTLTWKLSTDGTVKNIDFSFNIYNTTNIIIITSICFAVIIGVIVAFIIIKKKRSSRDTLIYTDYDASIAKEVENEIK